MSNKEDIKTVTISIERYRELLNCECLLYALEANGVNNWEGYDTAVESIEED